MRTILKIFILSSIAFACKLETELKKAGLENVSDLLPDAKVDLIYATSDNMFGKPMLSCLRSAYLQKEALERLKIAENYLKKRHPSYNFKILDATRPRSIQQKMWVMVVNTPLQPYVANPKRGSMHNYGAAVDITIIDENGNELDMGEPTPRFKIVGKKPEELKSLLDNNKVSKQQASNRALLKAAMESAGYFGLSHEWWHFRAFSKKHVRKTYKIVE